MIRFQVFGQPGTKGSAQAFIVPPINTVERVEKVLVNMREGGYPPRAIITNDAGEKAKSWAAVVSDGARSAMGSARPLDGPIRLSINFHLPRPRAHYRKDGSLKANAPTHAPTRPDGDKLERCTWDALTGLVFLDDSQIVKWAGEKLYTSDGRTGATIEAEPIATLTAPTAPLEEEVL